MNVKFCGAAREVTGSAHLLTLDGGYKILLDCGLYQGGSDSMKNFNEKWLFDPRSIDCVVLSHAHIDHSGRLPKLVKDGFEGPIYSTHATRSLCAIMLLDSALIQERDAEFFNKRRRHNRDEREPLYSEDDVRLTMERFVTFGYSRKFEVRPGVEVEFRDAGHILGSASVGLTILESGKTIRIGFSGDIGRPNRPILRDPQQMPEVDYLICESTYGDKFHESPPQEIDHLLHIIRHTCFEKRGKLIIPAFGVGRTQEIVYIMDQLENAGKLPPMPVYVDSPLAVNATVIYGSHPECYDADLSTYILKDPNPFGFSRLTYIKEVEDSKKLNASDEPCVIISASGMANAGRVKHHLFNNIDNPRNTVLIVGYCSPETPGGRLRDGATHLRLFGEEKFVRCDVEVMDSFSAHADRGEISDFVANQRQAVKKMFLVHGEIERQESLKSLLLGQGFRHIEIPKLGEAFEIS
ncbi:MAG: MBL fold metallo-hydrolase [Bacteroidetes bacterium]|nr:MBL fold metallo-hydrolase [Bacteroidota bacterium]